MDASCANSFVGIIKTRATENFRVCLCFSGFCGSDFGSESDWNLLSGLLEYMIVCRNTRNLILELSRVF